PVGDVHHHPALRHLDPVRCAVAGRAEEEPAGGPPAMSSRPALIAHGLTKRFKTGRTYIEVLKAVDFDAAHGDVTMVMGPSGSGKSTLVATLSGLLQPDEGSVTALGQDIWNLRAGKRDK